MRTLDLGLIPYRDAWRIQEELHAQVLAGEEEALLVLEHAPVITLGRRTADAQKNLLAAPEALSQLGVEVVESDRGGDITFHGPGQLVAYPIVRLNDHGLSVGGYVRRLEDAVIATLAHYDIPAFKDDCAIGVWVHLPPSPPQRTQTAKICALGVRIKRGVSMHGIALNLTTDLSYFNLINPCGLGRPVTSMRNLLGDRTPEMADLKQAMADRFVAVFR
ncbi:MAG TPA: lipoyl(octanoyl) transferase LipB [Tepidisphaeraceae bacterium]|jgi:lipoate-protein ligase B